jgi:hypothetical protein
LRLNNRTRIHFEGRRRAREHRRRAAKLTEDAERVRDAGDRRHLLDLAECYQRSRSKQNSLG